MNVPPFVVLRSILFSDRGAMLEVSQSMFRAFERKRIAPRLVRTWFPVSIRCPFVLANNDIRRV